MANYFPSPSSAAPATYFNLSPARLSKTRIALGRVMAGTGNARVLFCGDSTMFYGANATNNLMRQNGLTAQLAKILNGQGLTATSENWIGNGGAHGTSSTTAQYESRVNVGTGWSAGVALAGGSSWMATGATGNLSFTPAINVNTFNVYYFQFSAGGSFQYNLNGGSNTTQTTSGAPGIQIKTVTGTLGANTINLNWVSGTVYILGVEAYNSAVPNVSLLNAGWVGAVSGDLTTLYTSGGSNPLAYGQDLTLLEMGINDWDAGVSLAAYLGNMQTAITNAKLVGDVLLMTPMPTNPTGNASVATQATFVAAMYQLAQTNNIPLIDFYARVQSYAAGQPLGYYYDSFHPNGPGYVDCARAIQNALLAYN